MIRRVAAEEIRPLRLAVLRPGKPAEAVVWPGDDVSVHLAAYDEQGGLAGCVSIRPQPCDEPPHPGAWQLRGMATDPAVRGQGYGGRLLDAAVEAAREVGAPMLWCNARRSARGFYRRGGWTATGEEFLTDTGLPHLRMWRDL